MEAVACTRGKGAAILPPRGALRRVDGGFNFWGRRKAAVAGQNPPLSALPNVTISGPIGNIPVFEATLGLILLVGAIYFFIPQRTAPETQAAKPPETRPQRTLPSAPPPPPPPPPHTPSITLPLP